MKEIEYLNDDTFVPTLAASEKMVVVKFGNTICTACVDIEPVIKELAAEAPNIDFYFLDTKESKQTKSIFGYKYVPMLLVFEAGGALIGSSLCGSWNKQDMIKFLNLIMKA